MNTGSSGAVDDAFRRIAETYESAERDTGKPTVLKGDHLTFCEIFQIYYDSLEYENGDAAKWMFQIPGMFHCEKVGIWDLVKWLAARCGMDEFLKDSGLPDSQHKRFGEYEHARRNKYFMFQFIYAFLIRLCENLLCGRPSPDSATWTCDGGHGWKRNS